MNQYAELLRDPRWQKRRLDVMSRDDFSCCKCGSRTETLHVHHRYYIAGRQPWDYPDNLLVTLCEKCHKEEEDCKDVVKEFVRTLQFWGYFNTDIRNLANELIEKQMAAMKK